MKKRQNGKKTGKRSGRNKQLVSRGGPGGIDRNKMLQQAYGIILQNQMNFLPPYIEVPMRYSFTLFMTLTAGQFLDYIFRANSLFDPDRTGIGHQPLGFDQLTPVYNRYRVDRLEWHIDFGSGSGTYATGVALINGAANLTSIEQMAEYPTARTHTQAFNGAPPAIFTGKKSLAAFNGRSDLSYNIDDTTGSLVNTNPVETIDLHVCAFNPNLASIAFIALINLKFRAVLYDPITPAQSFAKSLELK